MARIILNNKYLQSEYSRIWSSKPNFGVIGIKVKGKTSKTIDVDAIVNRGYGVCDRMYEESVVFVGLNPAYGKDDQPGNSFFNLLGKPSYKYFTAIDEFCNQIMSKIQRNFDYSYSIIDMFAIRHTNEADIKIAIDKIPAFKQFCQQQFDVFKGILQTAKPKAIVVCNAYASGWFKKGTLNPNGFDLYWDDLIGTWRIQNDVLIQGVKTYRAKDDESFDFTSAEPIECNSNDSRVLDSTPVYFSSMLSGQRALDNGSKERLQWQIASLLQGKTMI